MARDALVGVDGHLFSSLDKPARQVIARARAVEMAVTLTVGEFESRLKAVGGEGVHSLSCIAVFWRP